MRRLPLCVRWLGASGPTRQDSMKYAWDQHECDSRLHCEQTRPVWTHRSSILPYRDFISGNPGGIRRSQILDLGIAEEREPAASMSCPDCFKGSLDDGTPTGEETKIAGLDVYVARPKEAAPAGKGKAVVLCTDIFGWKLVNVRLVADEMASRLGHEVLVPDFFQGTAAPADLIDVVLKPSESFLARMGQYGKMLLRIPGMIYWISTHTKARYLPIISKWFDDVRAERSLARIGAQGFCWGGRYAIIMGGAGKVEYFVAAHPSSSTVRHSSKPLHTARLRPSPAPQFCSTIRPAQTCPPPRPDLRRAAALEGRRGCGGPGPRAVHLRAQRLRVPAEVRRQGTPCTPYSLSFLQLSDRCL